MAAETDYYTEGYEHTDDLVRQALDQGCDIAVEGVGWHEGPHGKMFQATATLTRPDGRILTLDGWAEAGDAQAPGADPSETPFAIIGRARTRAARAVARVVVGLAAAPEEGQPDWQVRLQTLMRQVGKVTGAGREAVAEQVCATFNVTSTTQLTQRQAEMAIRELQERVGGEVRQ